MASASVSEALLFPVADSLQVNLHLVGDGFKAHQPIKTNLLGFDITCDMKVKSDVLTPTHASFFIQVRKHLWLYVVSYAVGKKLKAMIFDSSVAKIDSGFMSTACGQGNLSTSITRLKASQALMYEFDQLKNEWNSCADFDDVLKA